jgi:hypothetical protein
MKWGSIHITAQTIRPVSLHPEPNRAEQLALNVASAMGDPS